MDFKIPIVGSGVTFAEIPGELAVYFEIGCCTRLCEHCHSPHHKEIGQLLSVGQMMLYARTQKEHGATAIVLMGGTSCSHLDREKLGDIILTLSRLLPVGLYSGDEVDTYYLSNRCFNLRWYKAGPYIDMLGGLTSSNTNQLFYRRNEDGEWELRNDLFVRQDTK